jgi:hypothetical protein
VVILKVVSIFYYYVLNNCSVVSIIIWNLIFPFFIIPGGSEALMRKYKGRLNSSSQVVSESKLVEI